MILKIIIFMIEYTHYVRIYALGVIVFIKTVLSEVLSFQTDFNVCIQRGNNFNG